MDNIYNFCSYNSTGLDKVKVQWIQDLLQTFNVDFLNIQEHFKAIKSVNQYFKKSFCNYDSFVTPAIRNSESHAGRPRGGLAQLSRKNKTVKKEKIICKNWRIQAQILHFAAFKLLWINVYFPVDPQSQFDTTELLQTLSDIEVIIESNKFNEVLVGGDMNYDISRSSVFCKLVSDFISKFGLVSVWEKFPADFTHQHTNLTSFSTIDHWFVSEHFLVNCLDAAPVHLGDNKSNHSPIMLKLNLPEVAQKETVQIDSIQKPQWNKAYEEDLNSYTNILHGKLETISVPAALHCQDVLCTSDQHSHDRDQYLVDVMEQVIETSHECIPVNKPLKQGGRQLLPGWKEHVEPLKNDALFWHSVWVSLGRPTTGGLFSVMKHTRNKYHFAVRKLKRQVNQMKVTDLLEAAESGNTALFKEMKKSLESKSSGQEVPDCLEGKVCHQDIIEKFRECYSELYNATDRNQEMESLNARIKQLISDNCDCSVVEVNLINSDVVKQAAVRMKPNKTDVSGSYTSDG